MVSRVWTWADLPEFLDEFEFTTNEFAEMIGFRQSTIRNVVKGHTKQPKPHVIKAIEEGMRWVRRCSECDTVLVEKPNAEPARKARKKARPAP